MTTETGRYAVNAGGQLTDDGRPMLTLVRAAWGDDAPPAATLDALTRAIPAALNAAAAGAWAPEPYQWMRPDIGTPAERAEVEAQWQAEQWAARAETLRAELATV